MTPAEAQLWARLRGLGPVRFRRQHPLGPFILDFYCPAAHLCVEVDGGIHDEAGQRERDLARTESLSTLGIRVIRFSNEEVLMDCNAVLNRVRDALTLNHHAESPYPRPLAGEGGERGTSEPGEGRSGGAPMP